MWMLLWTHLRRRYVVPLLLLSRQRPHAEWQRSKPRGRGSQGSEPSENLQRRELGNRQSVSGRSASGRSASGRSVSVGGAVDGPHALAPISSHHILARAPPRASVSGDESSAQPIDSASTWRPPPLRCALVTRGEKRGADQQGRSNPSDAMRPTLVLHLGACAVAAAARRPSCTCGRPSRGRGCPRRTSETTSSRRVSPRRTHTRTARTARTLARSRRAR